MFDLDAHLEGAVKGVRFLKTPGLIHKPLVLMHGHGAKLRSP